MFFHQAVFFSCNIGRHLVTFLRKKKLFQTQHRRKTENKETFNRRENRPKMLLWVRRKVDFFKLAPAGTRIHDLFEISSPVSPLSSALYRSATDPPLIAFQLIELILLVWSN